MQQDGKIGRQADRAYMFSRESMVITSETSLFSDEDALHALINSGSGGSSCSEDDGGEGCNS